MTTGSSSMMVLVAILHACAPPGARAEPALAPEGCTANGCLSEGGDSPAVSLMQVATRMVKATQHNVDSASRRGGFDFNADEFLENIGVNLSMFEDLIPTRKNNYTNITLANGTTITVNIGPNYNVMLPEILSIRRFMIWFAVGVALMVLLSTCGGVWETGISVQQQGVKLQLMMFMSFELFFVACPRGIAFTTTWFTMF